MTLHSLLKPSLDKDIFSLSRPYRRSTSSTNSLHFPPSPQSNRMGFLSAFVGAAAVLAGSVSAYYPQGFITQPANGTHIAPGQAFNFTYNIRADYCTSSYNYTVWLLTSDPSTITTLAPRGKYLGRFAGASYPSE